MTDALQPRVRTWRVAWTRAVSNVGPRCCTPRRARGKPSARRSKGSLRFFSAKLTFGEDYNDQMCVFGWKSPLEVRGNCRICADLPVPTIHNMLCIVAGAALDRFRQAPMRFAAAVSPSRLEPPHLGSPRLRRGPRASSSSAIGKKRPASEVTTEPRNWSINRRSKSSTTSPSPLWFTRRVRHNISFPISSTC